MFCPNCGTEIAEDSVFCGVCGQRVDMEGDDSSVQQTTDVTSPGILEPTQQKKKNIKVFLTALGGIAAFVLIAAFALNSIGGGYSKPLNNLCNLLNKKEANIEKYIDAACPKFMVNAYQNGVSLMMEVDDFEEMMDEAQDNIKDGFDEIKDQFGSDVKVKYEILDKEKLSKSKLKQIKNSYKELRTYLKYVEEDGIYYEELEESLNTSSLKKFNKLVQELSDDLKELEITDGYALEISISVAGKSDDEEEEIEINVIKVNGKWCLDLTSSIL